MSPRIQHERGRFGKVLATVAVVTAVVGGGIGATHVGRNGAPPAAPSAAVANAWVDGNGGSCTHHATAAEYVDAEACSSFDAAWDASSSGDVIRVKDHAYGNQVITGNKTAETCFIGETQAGTTITGGEAQGNFQCLQNLTIDSGSGTGWSFRTEADDIHFNDVLMRGSKPGLEVFSGNRFIWDGGVFGGTTSAADTPGLRCQGSPNFDIEPIQVDGGSGVQLKNIIVWPGAGSNVSGCGGVGDGFHEEDVRWSASSGTIDRVIFKDGSGVTNNGDSGKIFVSGTGVNLTVQNTILGPSCCSTAMQDNGTSCTITIRYTTFTAQGDALDQCSATVLNNIGPNATGVDSSGHLTSAATSAIDQGASTCASDTGGVDVDGDTRPHGSACDKGADEYQG